MRWMQRWASAVDHVLFVLAGVLAVWLASMTLAEGIAPGWPMALLIVFWVLVAYMVLPRLHRILTGIYLPDYFIGRTRTADGLLGDPVNLGVRGGEAALHQAMAAAGWIRAEEVSLASGWQIVVSTLTRRSYPEAPVSPLFLFRKQQEFAYQQEVAGSPAKRHHVRFWKCPDGWLLPGGFAVDWLGAATFDTSVRLSLFTLQVTHRIDADTDAERDYLIASVRQAVPSVEVNVLDDFSSGYHSRNGGGDLITTDGHLPILELGSDAPVLEPKPARPLASSTRPAQTVFGVAATGLRAVALLWLGALSQTGLLTGDPGAQQAVAIFLWVAGLLDLALAVATWFGHNWSRLALAALSVLSVGEVVVDRASTHQYGPLHADLVPLAISVLVLLALSSTPAREFATRTHAAAIER